MHLTLEQLFARARQESPPMVKVADGVILSLSRQERHRADQPLKPMLWVSLVATSIAAALLVALRMTWRSGDVIDDILNMVVWAG